ncbi:ATP-binding protein [Marinobacter daqiaonensis]|uniref:ATP-binding protein n=1 Tax=Marinobacter daqiaonensis TaxID=650891 RepID=UPI003877F43C
MLGILEDRHASRFTDPTSQIPIDKFYEVIGDATLAGAILDRLVHNVYKINLRGNPCENGGEIDGHCNSGVARETQRLYAPMGGSLFPSGWQASHGMGGNLQRFTQKSDKLF